jgi:hypothetical protein
LKAKRQGNFLDRINKIYGIGKGREKFLTELTEWTEFFWDGEEDGGGRSDVGFGGSFAGLILRQVQDEGIRREWRGLDYW